MTPKKQNAMKALIKLSALVLLTVMGLSLKAQDYRNERLNLPGDNLNLYAVMDLFQKSETLEGFERALNNPEQKINNLDLNGDNYVDYIRVIDYPKGNDHTIVLQVAINERETQDVAVITVVKDKRGEIFVQMIGDEYLYGKDYIIEPIYAETPNPAYTGNNRVVTTTTYVEVRTWPVVRYIYAPSYVVWYSPWHWGYYPGYWASWRPFYWDYYYGYHSHWHHHYYAHYRYSNHYRFAHYHDWYYRGHRHHSTTVVYYREKGRYNNTYSRPDLRSEGSAEYVRRYGNSGSGRDANGTAMSNTGRVKQTENTNLSGRTSTPMVNNRASQTPGRVSADQTAGRTEPKKATPAPAVSSRKAEPTGRSSSGQTPVRVETKREAATPQRVERTEPRKASPAPSVSSRSSQSTERSSAPQRVERTETRREAPAPSVSSRSSQSSSRSSAPQRVERTETRREAPAPSVSSRSSQSSSRSSAPQSVSRSESPRQASAPSVSRSESPKSSAPAKAAAESRSISSGSKKGGSGR